MEGLPQHSVGPVEGERLRESHSISHFLNHSHNMHIYLCDLCLALWVEDALSRAAESGHQVIRSATERSWREVRCVG